MVGEHPEQPEVVVVERAHLAETVGHDHHARHTRLASQGHRHGVLDLETGQLSGAVVAPGPRNEDGVARDDRLPPRLDSVRSIEGAQLGRLLQFVALEGDAKRRLVARAEERDLRYLRPQKIACLREHCVHHRLGLHRTTDRA